MGWRVFKRAVAPAATPAAPAPTPPPARNPPQAEGPERLTANEWAKRHRLNEVQAERAAMRAGRWHDLFTEEEFLDLLRRGDA